MARGFVRKRGSTWYAYRRNPEGKPKAKALGPHKKAAEAYLDEVHAAMNQGIYREIPEIGFDDFAKRWLEDYAEPAVKASTFATYRSRILNQYIPFFGSQRLTSITADRIQRYVSQKRTEGLGPVSVADHLSLLKTMLRRAVIWGYLKQNPAEYISAPKGRPKEMDFLTPDEVRALLHALDPDYRALFTTAVLTGMRLGELLALQWDDIQWHSGTIYVRRSLYRGQFVTPKSKRSTRAVGMSPILRDTLLEHKVNAPANSYDLVFTTPSGAMIEGTNLRHRVYETALRRAGLRKVRIHDLRHTFASLLIHQGENFKYIQAQLGHASITTTVDRYGHLMPHAHVGAGERLDATLFGEPEGFDDKMMTNGLFGPPEALPQKQNGPPELPVSW